jgi:hypothetical protein
MVILLFKSIIMSCGTDMTPWNISHIRSDCGEYPRISRGVLLAPQNINMDMKNVMMQPKNFCKDDQGSIF